MPKFAYKGSVPRTYIDYVDQGADHVLEVSPGEVYEITEAPDDLFEAIAKKIAKDVAETPSEETN